MRISECNGNKICMTQVNGMYEIYSRLQFIMGYFC